MSSEYPDNFMGLGPEFSTLDSARFVIHSIPFDKTCSWERGASGGPRGAIEASKQVELFDIETRSEPYRQGIYTAPVTEAETSEEMIEKGRRDIAASLAKGKFVITLGGDHSISHAPIKAHLERFPKMSILHIDAHGDRAQALDGNPLSHGSIIARASEWVNNIVSVGIRSMDINELNGVDEKKIFWAHEMRDSAVWIPKVLAQLGPEVYITLDVDAFDSSLMPSTGTPQPGGMQWYDMLALLKGVIEKHELVGMDVVELAPVPSNRAPDFLVAKLIYSVMAYLGTVR